MKAQIGVDAVTELIHTVVATSSNVADVTMADHLIRESDKRACGDNRFTDRGNYLDEEKKKEAADSRCCVAAKLGTIKKIQDSPLKTLLMALGETKGRRYVKVERLLHAIKYLFGYRKVPFTHLEKIHARLFSLNYLTIWSC